MSLEYLHLSHSDSTMMHANYLLCQRPSSGSVRLTARSIEAATSASQQPSSPSRGRHFGAPLALFLSIGLLAGFSASVTAQEATDAATSETAKTILAPAIQAEQPVFYHPPEDVEPVANQEVIQEAYRLDADDRAFLKYLVPLTPLQLELPSPIPAEYYDDLDNPVAKLPDGRILTVGDLYGFLFAEGRRGEFRYFQNSPAYLTQGLTRSAFLDAVEEVASKQGFEKNKSFLASVRVGNQASLRPVLLEYAYATRGKPITDDDVAMQYERSKNTRYKIRFNFEAYNIFLMGYQHYTTTAADVDLREVARRLSGSELAVTEIRTDDPSKKRRWVPEQKRGEIPWEPLQAGEKLLVPLDEGGMEELAAKAEEIRNRIEAGEDFLELAREFSDSEVVDQPINPQRASEAILPEIRLAIEQTDEGEITPVVRTKHGYNVFKVVSKQNEDFVPLDQVKPGITANLRRRAVADAYDIFYDDLVSTPSLWINEDLLRETADEAFLPQDAVLARYNGQELYFADLVPTSAKRDDFRRRTVDGRIDLVEKAMVISDLLTTDFAAQEGLTDDPAVKNSMPFYRRYTLGRFHERKFFEDGFRETTPLLYEYYKRNEETFAREAKYDLRLLAVRYDPDALIDASELRTHLRNLVPTIDSEERFIEVLRAEVEDESLKEQDGLAEDVIGSALGPDLNERLSRAEIGTVIGPVELDNDQMALIYLKGRKEAADFTFEQAFGWVAAEYNRFLRANMGLARFNEVVEEISDGIEWLYPGANDAAQ